MFTVRYGTFETNSSSTHSIVICSEAQFNEWKAGKIRFDPYSEKFTIPFTEEQEREVRRNAASEYRSRHSYSKYYKSWEELDEETKEEFIQSLLSSLKPNGHTSMTFDDYRYYHKESCEYSEKHFVTEHGDKVVAFGKGGYDG